ncbi:hypothetical protein BJX63DRAFT_429655 [Aspergillus granulosus]|uniref:Uncharacterized protein n=1 Tax=Aspergillus granulosus TaxID=176169 RepID=A0ABR4HQ49_9EURO
MEQLQGRWVIDKALSTGTDDVLKLQGVPWALRKAISFVTITFDITLYTTSNTSNEPAPMTPPATVIEIQITPTGGLPGTKEIRVLDWSEQEQTDFAFGTTRYATGFVTGKRDDKGDMYPDIVMKRKVSSEKVQRFLRGEVLEDGTASKWFLGNGLGSGEEAVWVHTFKKSVPEKWTVEQVWGFEEIDGNLYHAQRFVAVDKKGGYVLGRALYKRLDDRLGQER